MNKQNTEYADQLYAINLPDPNMPAYNPQFTLYMGTKDELLAFVERLEALTAATYYQEFIDAIRNHSENLDANYTLAGRTLIHPVRVKEVGRKEFVLTDYLWSYKSKTTGCEYLMKADMVWLSYVVIELRGKLFRCDRALFENLSISMPGIGWVTWGVISGGTPGMAYLVCSQHDETKELHMSLYRGGMVYSQESTPADAITDLPSMMSPYLDTALAEMVGQL